MEGIFAAVGIVRHPSHRYSKWKSAALDASAATAATAAPDASAPIAATAAPDACAPTAATAATVHYFGDHPRWCTAFPLSQFTIQFHGGIWSELSSRIRDGEALFPLERLWMPRERPSISWLWKSSRWKSRTPESRPGFIKPSISRLRKSSRRDTRAPTIATRRFGPYRPRSCQN